MANGTKLYRDGKWPLVTRAIVREDGVHVIDHDGSERKEAAYPDLETMNRTLRDLCFQPFAVVNEWPK